MISRLTNRAIVCYNNKTLVVHNLNDFSDNISVTFKDAKNKIFGCPCCVGESIYVILLNKNAILEVKPLKLDSKTDIELEMGKQI